MVFFNTFLLSRSDSNPRPSVTISPPNEGKNRGKRRAGIHGDLVPGLPNSPTFFQKSPNKTWNSFDFVISLAYLIAGKGISVISPLSHRGGGKFLLVKTSLRLDQRMDGRKFANVSICRSSIWLRSLNFKFASRYGLGPLRLGKQPEIE